MFVCPICGNEDERYIGWRKGEPYCRRCIGFNGRRAPPSTGRSRAVSANLTYALTPEQEQIAFAVKEAHESGKNVLIHAVCGAGKTELVYAAVAASLSRGEQVGFAVPRKDVVIDLLPRFASAFPDVKVTAVYGGNTTDLSGELLLLTTHQLYRYERYFDLLILDETDAFPFWGNPVLKAMLSRALKGTCVMMSATPLPEMIRDIQECGGTYLQLQKRYHGYPIPVPVILVRPYVWMATVARLLRRFIKNRLPTLIFVPTIADCERLIRMLLPFFRSGSCVHSKRADREKTIRNFKEGAYRYLVTTSVLERGVTVKKLQVIVLWAHHILYDEKALVQIAGRVGRKSDAPEGEVIFIADYSTKAMRAAVETIRKANEALPHLL